MRRIVSFLLTLCLLLGLVSCGSGSSSAESSGSGATSSAPLPSGSSSAASSGAASTAGNTSSTAPEVTDPVTPPPTETPTTPETPPSSEVPPTPETPPTPEPPVVENAFDPNSVNWVEWKGRVEHLFFHPVVAYPELAFDGDYKSNGIDDWMVTADEYRAILQSVYEKGFVLVDINQVWEESVNADGQPVMIRSKLMVPEGKKPLVFSYDDVNYYEYMLKNGFTYKLVLGEDGQLWSYGKDPQGNDVYSQDLDAVTILDKFVREHPDFSPYGAKGSLSLTGYEGILGYRTQTDKNNSSAEFEANRQKEIEAVKPIIEELKRTGWTFGCHTWGHINLNTKGLSTIQTDLQKWFDEVGSLIGETSILFYPHGARPDGDDWKKTGEEFRYLHSLGFRVFCSVGIESWSHIKKDISAVICDRLHPDGTTLRGSDKTVARYSQFYDARDIIDLEVRPDRGVKWTPKS